MMEGRNLILGNFGPLAPHFHQRDVVMLAPEAQKTHFGPEVSSGDLHPQDLPVEPLGPFQVPNVEHHVAKTSALERHNAFLFRRYAPLLSRMGMQVTVRPLRKRVARIMDSGTIRPRRGWARSAKIG